MNAFQVLGLATCGAFIVGLLVSLARHRLGPIVGFAWLVLWSAAGLAIARPELTVAVARLLGIARGADLVFYFAILAMLIGFFAVFLQFRRLESEITVLVRHVALRDAEDGDPGGSSTGEGGPETPGRPPGASA